MPLQRSRESLTLILLALLPFHAFLVTVLTKMIAGANHAPLVALAIWKEALLVVILFIAFVEILKKRCFPRFDIFDAMIIALGVLSLGLFIANHQSLGVFALGFKYDLLPLLAFLILRRIPWSDPFRKSIINVLLIDSILIGIFAIFSVVAAPGLLQWMGYSDLHSLYVSGGSLAPFQQIEGIGLRRLQSTFAGPNQMGLWLLIPFAAYLASRKGPLQIWQRDITTIFFLLTILTFSRAAILAFFVMTTVDLWFRYSRRDAIIRCGILYGLFGFLFLLVLHTSPNFLFRTMSTRGHWQRPLQAVQMMITHPLGLGLGTAGPASNRFSDTCVQLPSGSDISWAKDRQDLCVFVDSTQMQPIGRSCSCPLLTENWYLQIGVELGFLGFVLYLLLTFFVLQRLWHEKNHMLLSFLGLSIAALFLHAFEDSAVAYSMWVLLSIAFATLPPCQHTSSRSQVQS